jgi:phosphopantothenoylcysteine decarboxylase/phosphopantothenate--cysteine ligase
MHPSEAIWCSKSDKLKGKKIALGITGSIAAIESVKLVRELIRHGAELYPIMSSEAQRIIHPNALEFAAGRKPVAQIGGDVPYIDLLEGKRKADLLLIAPCTSNTVSKIAWGFSDTTVSLFATQAIGLKIPMILVPTMHEPMYKNPVISDNIKTLKKLKIGFIDPRMEEGAAKLAGIDEIVSRTIKAIGKDSNTLMGKKVVVIGGAAREPIDDVRFITSHSTGATAVELAKGAFEKGAKVQLLMGMCEVDLPEYIPTKRFRTVKELLRTVKRLKMDICLVPASLSDYAAKKSKGKIPSNLGKMSLDLEPMPKVIEAVRKRKCLLVGFKAEYEVSKRELQARAMKRLKSAGLDIVVANDLTKVGKRESEVLVLDKKGKKRELKGTRPKIAEGIWSAVIHGIR